MRQDRRLRHSLLAVAALAAALQAQGVPIGFEETWALAPDRAKVVNTLIPGTDDFYYYHCRERLDARDFATVRKVLPTWVRQHGDNQRVVEIQNRLALLGVDDAPDATFNLLRQRLGVSYNHFQVVPGARSDLPTQLDPELLSVQKLTAAALARHQGSLRGFTTRALPALASTTLTAPQLRDLLGRLDRPDVDNLAELVVRDLRAEGSRGFGSLQVHGLLRLPQLEQCARLMPELLQHGKFVDAWLRLLRPDADTEWQQDPAAYVAQLDRLWQFAQRLPSSFNSLKAQVLYRWLEQDLARGEPDKQRFLTYIRLPRRGEHVAETHLRRFQDGAEFVDPARRFATALPVIGDDAPLLRACLEHFFASEDGYETYAEFLDARWLRSVLAETKLLLGQGDLARWYTLLDDPTRADTIEKRVELVFPPTMRRVYAPEDAVTLELDVKNVPQLVVKVWSIDAWRYLCEKQLPVNATIELDGVVANEERTFTYDTPPLRRVRRSFDLPSLRAPGTYVVEFVGNGISSRAVIQKGSLRLAERTAAAGQVVRVYDQDGRLRPQATAWFGGREYPADAEGDILIPFSTAPGEKKLVLRDGAVATLVPFAHRAESYTLAASAFVPREALIAGGSASLAVRPTLRLDDHDVALSLLQEPLLTIVATDLNGVVTRKEVRDLRLVDEREFVHEIAVPERLLQLQVSLRGKVKNLAGEPVELATAETVWQLNGIDAGAATATPMLLATPDGFVLELRGKNGEQLAGRTCSLQLQHRDFTDSIGVSLQTDDAGRIRLGALPGIEWLDMQYAGSSTGFSTLRTAACRLPQTLHGTADQTLRLPYTGTRTTVQRDEFMLLGADRDRFEHLALADGFLELRALPPGDYELRVLDADARIQVRITRGDADGEWLIGRHRLLERPRPSPLQLREAQLDGQGLRVQLANHGPDSRVLVFTTRYLPATDPFVALLGPAAPAPVAFTTDATESTYDSGRQLGDEYRYVLERRFAAKYPGNMLARPSLLVNPWALENSTNDALDQSGGAGGRYGGRAGGRGGKSGGKNADLAQRNIVNPGAVANLDFLPRGATLLANLIPDAAGVVVVPPQALGDGQQVHVLALDGQQAIYRSLVRAEVALTPRSRTLQQALDSKRHLTEQKRIEFVAAGGTTTLDDPRSAQVEVFDSLTSVFRLFASLSGDDDWSRFGFVTTWPQLDAKQRRELYDQHACHELNFFLYQKDRAFFDAVIRPLLACKLEKTFLDHWLCGDDLTRYTGTWAFGQLNLIERILLAQRLDGPARQAVARSIQEQLELRPIAVHDYDALVETALRSNSLAEGRAAGKPGTNLLQNLERAIEEKSDAPREAAEQAGALAPKPRGGGGGGRNEEPQAAAPGAPPPPPASKAETGSDDFYLRATRGAEAEKRKQVRALFRAVNPTKLHVEQNWWHIRRAASTNDLVWPNRFWADYATAPAGQPFASPAIVEASNSFLEMMMALAVLDLPFVAEQHAVTADGDKRTLRAASPLLLVRKEVTKAEKATTTAPLLLGENFFRLDDRYRFENGQQRDAFVTDEFLVDVAYGCQVVVTNPTSQPRTAELLLQIPAGAVPVQRGFWTKGVTVQLAPYGTQTVEYAFYFPAAGDFVHYPVHAAEKQQLAAFAEPRTLHVVLTPQKLDTSSWEHVSQQGSAADVLTFLDTHNLQRLDLDKIAWRMKDKAFFASALQKLRERRVYHATLWSYALLHQDRQAAREYLQHQDGFLSQCGAAIDSPLLAFEPRERRWFEQLELDPLVHARAHRFGGRRVLGNQDLARQYAALMTMLGYHAQLDADDWLVVTYYLLLQDRVEEALQAFQKVDPAKVATRIQFDYLHAYLCFFTGDVDTARRLAEAHKDAALPHWQKRFRDVLSQLDEAAGKTSQPGETTPDDLAATAPSLELAVEGQQVRIDYKNLTQCEVRYYELDVEFAFSAQPFANEGGTSAAFVQPNTRELKDLPGDRRQLTFELPKNLQNKNVLVELRGAGIVRSRQCFANDFELRVLESYGQLAVAEPGSHAPLPRTYVKVFARLPDGTVRFHKDGYTDLRGRFDYASVSDDPDANAIKYAVLVLHDQRGAAIREVNPPTK